MGTTPGSSSRRRHTSTHTTLRRRHGRSTRTCRHPNRGPVPAGAGGRTTTLTTPSDSGTRRGVSRGGPGPVSMTSCRTDGTGSRSRGLYTGCKAFCRPRSTRRSGCDEAGSRPVRRTTGTETPTTDGGRDTVPRKGCRVPRKRYRPGRDMTGQNEGRYLSWFALDNFTVLWPIS